ncbi:hypothetical protein H6770_05480 [Candidatus Peribacteria bacterium]|nr:hypothetical protein [Candidatus Peribacteria bacterium]
MNSLHRRWHLHTPWHRERRELYVDNVDTIMNAYDHWPDEQQANIDTLAATLQSKTDAKRFLDTFSIYQQNAWTEGDIEQYAKLHANTDPNSISTFLLNILLKRRDPDVHIRLAADTQLNNLLEYLNKRRDILNETRDELSYASERQEFPTPAHEAWDKTKEIAGGFLDGFNNGTGKEKLTMIAGAVVALMLLRKMMDSSKKFKTAVGVAIGGSVLVAAIGALNRTVERTSGKPIFNLEGGPWFPMVTETQEQWDAQKHERELNLEWKRLREKGIPVDVITSIVSTNEEKRRYAFGITNVCALDMKELQALYLQHRNNKIIPESVMPRAVFDEDHLSETERFILVEDIAHDLRCLDSSGNWQWSTPEMEKKNVLTAILTTL